MFQNEQKYQKYFDLPKISEKNKFLVTDVYKKTTSMSIFLGFLYILSTNGPYGIKYMTDFVEQYISK